MTKAYVLINSDIGKERKVMKDLEKIENVRGVWEVYGVYDIVTELEGNEKEDIDYCVRNKIRTLDDVRSILAMFVVE
jgi:DNA-binding Lrp family transcriptional regulator